MHRPLLTCAFLAFSAAAFAQQQSSPSDPYQGQSSPPADDVIVATQPDQPTPPKAKPPAGKPLVQAQPAPQPAPPAASAAPIVTPPPTADNAARPTSADAADNPQDADGNGTDEGIVGVAKPEPQSDNVSAGGQPTLMTRDAAADPDGDIVHPHPLQPGELADGTTIRVRLLTRLSSVDSKQGEEFRTRVASDVLQDDQVLIPAGAEIDGRVVQVETGTSRSHGTMLLRPDTVILADGSRYHLDAQVTGTPGSRTQVGGEGYIKPGSRLKRNAMYYGGAVGVGAATGAMIGGPVGALTGSIIGAGVVTLHIVVNHSDATLEPGTVLLLTLNNRLALQAAPPTTPTGN